MPNPFLRPPPRTQQVPEPIQNNAAMAAQENDPFWKKKLRQGFEGATDLTLGALGVGPDSTMNRAGQLGMAGMTGMPAMKGMGSFRPSAVAGENIGTPLVNGIRRGYTNEANSGFIPEAVKSISHLSQTPDIESYKQFIAQGMSHPEALAAAAGNGPRAMQSYQAMDNLYNPASRNPQIIDEAGRPLANAPSMGIDPSYASHVTSSRNKNPMLGSPTFNDPDPNGDIFRRYMRNR